MVVTREISCINAYKHGEVDKKESYDNSDLILMHDEWETKMAEYGGVSTKTGLMYVPNEETHILMKHLI